MVFQLFVNEILFSKPNNAIFSLSLFVIFKSTTYSHLTNDKLCCYIGTSPNQCFRYLTQWELYI